MTARLACLVPGCRCTTAVTPMIERHGPMAEWICAKHWRAVPQFERRHLAKARRYLRRRYSQTIARVADRAWQRCKAEAIAAATGSITNASLAEFVDAL